MMELRTENLVVGYDKTPLIKDVNLKVVSGQVLTLIGPNGAGKSTILKTITRQLKRIGGTIYLGQESMNNMRDSDVSKSLSMVMTERLQTELLTGRDVVASGRYPYTGRVSHRGLGKSRRSHCTGACAGCAGSGFSENE